MMELIISLLTGAVGGNVAGALLKKFSMGTLWNSVVGILGGGLGAQLLGMLGLDLGGIVGSLAGGTVGGGALMAIIGVIKSAMSK
ncbi:MULTISPECIES: hypothetical protein [Tenacibaculum]|uniref:hypothetical protein n=1 Tax=Tenacibaculum TaxID=104267 RepID=UPI001F0B46D6|nr:MULTISPECIES: hypothetical protein [Tenacibaculum]MCH3881419.1 hypothetical protein [Tenacibaculum aquimarinum]MCH3883711.1 hypothetical protein [Tenacibaculum aquimarinum]MDO6598987.1 hypothetical protein [Tenacibaculum sp. 1_MG-2023]